MSLLPAVVWKVGKGAGLFPEEQPGDRGEVGTVAARGLVGTRSRSGALPALLLMPGSRANPPGSGITQSRVCLIPR